MGESNFSFCNVNGTIFALTEDKILVFNIFIYKISNRLKSEDIKRYFQKYGEVVKFQLRVRKIDGRRRVPKIGFVHFKEPEAAAKALQKTMHEITEKRILFCKACDSWIQPQADCQYTQLASPQQTKILRPRTTIADLNDDCLLHIYGMMQLREQVLFACSNSRFEQVFQLYAKAHYKSVRTEIFEELTLWNIRQFFAFAGSSIETIVGCIPYKNRERIIEFIKTHCCHLKTLTLQTTKVKAKAFKLLNKKPNLCSLNMINCGLVDASIPYMKNLQKLRTLVITQSYEFRGRHLYQLPHLRTLRLINCNNLQSSCLHRAITSMSELTFLDIQGSGRLSNELLVDLPKIAVKLETLFITCTDINYETIAQLPKLKHLSLLSNSTTLPLRKELFRDLIKYAANRLETLKIRCRHSIDLERCELISKLVNLQKLHFDFNAGINDDCLNAFSKLKNLEELKLASCTNFTSGGLLDFIRNGIKLKWLNICYCKHITNDFAKKLIKILCEENPLRGHVITVLVADTSINKDVVQQYLNVQKNKPPVYFIHKHPQRSNDNIDDASFDEIPPYFNENEFNSDSDSISDDDYFPWADIGEELLLGYMPHDDHFNFLW